MKNVVIIGGGAAGLMAAVTSADNGNNVTLIEKNARVGRKLMITGKGRCNVCNNCDIDTLINNIPKNAKFLYSAFSMFSPQQLMEFFESRKVPLKTERGNRVFPVSDKAVDIVDALYNAVIKSGAKIITSTAEKLITSENKVIGVKLQNGDILPADSVIIATGGMSYHLTGSTGDGYKMASELGHTVTELKPSLVPITIHEGFCTHLSGLSLKNVTLNVFEVGKKKPLFSELGEMLFTHFGISGPLVLSASSHIRYMGKKQYIAFIDLKPALSKEQLDNRILRDFSEEQNKNFANSLDRLLPKSLIPVIVKLSNIPSDLKVNQITKEQRLKLIDIIKALPLHITGFRPIDEAIITSGGISVKEIDPKTMESKLVSGLYFAGEIIDVDAYTGGFNLQIAFSTGFAAGTNA
ncbi:MAG: NAD(P)/FAD-dependent oxidoreductase [Clostridia bacterium]|nr:NAD(P)/FAD-dependent oxidoreductase [Clostridia bacterium]